MRLFHRAFRRALLPLAVSRGKTPRPRISIPYPLPVGVESDCEILEAGLDYPIRAEDLSERLNRCLPEGVTVRAPRTLAPGERHALVGVRYAVEGDGLPDESRLSEFRNSPAWKVDRRKNERLVSVDIRPYVRSLERIGDRRLELHLGVADGRSTRPDELLAALGLDAHSIARLRVVRCEIVESAETGPAGRGPDR
jgi:radical SAM-linked protein